MYDFFKTSDKSAEDNVDFVGNDINEFCISDCWILEEKCQVRNMVSALILSCC